MLMELFNKLRPKKAFKEYEFRVVEFDLPQDGKVKYAQWQHPGEHGNVMRQEQINFYRNYVKKGDPSYGNGGIVGFTYNQSRNVRYQLKVSGKNLENYLR